MRGRYSSIFHRRRFQPRSGCGRPCVKPQSCAPAQSDGRCLFGSLLYASSCIAETPFPARFGLSGVIFRILPLSPSRIESSRYRKLYAAFKEEGRCAVLGVVMKIRRRIAFAECAEPSYCPLRLLLRRRFPLRRLRLRPCAPPRLHRLPHRFPPSLKRSRPRDL